MATPGLACETKFVPQRRRVRRLASGRLRLGRASPPARRLSDLPARRPPCGPVPCSRRRGRERPLARGLPNAPPSALRGRSACRSVGWHAGPQPGALRRFRGRRPACSRMDGAALAELLCPSSCRAGRSLEGIPASTERAVPPPPPAGRSTAASVPARILPGPAPAGLAGTTQAIYSYRAAARRCPARG